MVILILECGVYLKENFKTLIFKVLLKKMCDKLITFNTFWYRGKGTYYFYFLFF